MELEVALKAAYRAGHRDSLLVANQARYDSVQVIGFAYKHFIVLSLL